MDDLKKPLDAAPVKPVVSPAPAPEPKASAPAKRKYVGPDYKYGIVLPGTTTQLDPKRMSETEIDALVAMYPETAKWWK